MPKSPLPLPHQSTPFKSPDKQSGLAAFPEDLQADLQEDLQGPCSHLQGTYSID